jgi:hypothetical protein
MSSVIEQASSRRAGESFPGPEGPLVDIRKNIACRPSCDRTFCMMVLSSYNASSLYFLVAEGRAVGSTFRR